MRFIELMIPERGEKYEMHIDENVKMETLKETLCERFESDKRYPLLYHVRTGKVLHGEISVKCAGIESGDRLMLLWR